MNILQKDISSYTKDQYFYFKRSFFSLLIIAFFCYFFSINLDNAGRRIFYMFYISSFIFFSIFIPIIASNSIVHEQKRQTLALLILSNTPTLHIIYQKFLAIFFVGSAYYLGIIPVLSMCHFLGDISYVEIIQCLLVVISFATVAISISLLVASFHISYQTQAFAFVVLLLWIAIMSLFSYLANILLQSHYTYAFSILFIVEIFLEKPSWLLCFFSVINNLFFSAMFLLVAGKLLNSYNDSGNISTDQKFRKKINICSNPIFWHDYYKVYGGIKYGFFKFILTILFTFLLWFFSATYFSSYAVNFGLLSFLICLFFSSTSALIFTIFSNCARSFIREKKYRNFDFLLLTSLNNRQIILGKYVAVLCNALPFFLLFFTASIMLIYKYPQAFKTNWLYIFIAMANLIAIFSCVFYFSLKTKSSGIASIYTYIIFIISHGLYSLLSKFIMKMKITDVFIMKTYYCCVGMSYIIAAVVFLRWTNKNLRA